MSDLQSARSPATGKFRFSLAQLLMGITLVAILLTFTQCDGCGFRARKISCLVFSSDGKRLAVARHDARDALEQFKAYLQDVSRTVSVFEVPSLQLLAVVEQELLPGNQGPAFESFGYVGRSLAFGQDAELLTVLDFSGGRVNRCDLKSLKRKPLFPQTQIAVNLAVSPDRSLLAVGHPEGVDLYDFNAGEKLRSIKTEPQGFMDAPLIAISPDRSLLATYGFDGAKLWNATTGQQIASIERRDDYGGIRNLAFSPSGRILAVAYADAVVLYQKEGVEAAVLAKSGRVMSARFVSDDDELAIGSEEGIQIFDVRSGKRLRVLTESRYGGQCIELSPDGKLLAASVAGTYVKLWDVQTGKLRATARPPGRYRPPWTLPATLLVVWGIAGWSLNRRRPLLPSQPAGTMRQSI